MATFHTPERQARHAALITAWKTHRDAPALEALIADYTPLFHAQIAGVMRGRVLSADHQADLVQECTFALMRAVEGYDAQKCPVIAPYLVRHVQGALRRYVLDFRAACRLGTSGDDRKAYYAAQRLRIRRLTEGQQALVESDIAAVAHDSATSLKTARRAVMSIHGGSVSLDEADQDGELHASPTDALDRSAIACAMAAFERHTASLPERTSTIVCETLLGHRMEGAVARMAQRYGISERRVRQIQTEGLEALRALMAQDNITADSVF